MSCPPDPIDNQGRWCEKDGRLYKSIRYWGGSVKWVPEGSVMHSGPANGPVTRVWRLRYTRWERLKEWLRGGPLGDRRIRG